MYQLIKIKRQAPTGARYHYKIYDSRTGRKVSERQSNRQYVAATIDGVFYFGRLDLIGKSAHAHYLKTCADRGVEPVAIAFLKIE